MIRLLLFVIRLCLSSMWYGVASRKDTRSTCLKEIGLCAQNMITIIGLHSQRNLRGGGGDLSDHLNVHGILCLITNKIFI